MEYKTICFYKFSIDLLHHRYVFHLYLWNLKNVLVIGWTKEILCFVCVCVLHYSRLSVTLWTVAHQAPLSMGFFQARTLDWVAISSSRGSSQPRYWTHISWIGRHILYHRATLYKLQVYKSQFLMVILYLYLLLKYELYSLYSTTYSCGLFYT